MELIRFIIMVYIIMVTAGGIYIVIKTFLYHINIEEEDDDLND